MHRSPSIKRKLLVLDSLFEGGRMFVGATSVTYLIKNGMSLPDIALLKNIQSITIIAGEVPTGLISDRYGHKKSLLLGLIATIAGCLLYFSQDFLFSYIVAEILAALGLCFWSGAFEAYSIESCRLTESKGAIDQFFHVNKSINSLSVLIFGGLGGWIGSQNLSWPYLAAAITLSVAALILTGISSTHVTKHEHRKVTFIQDIENQWITLKNASIKSPLLRPFFLISIGIQFIIQPTLHFWQPFFYGLSNTLKPQDLGFIFSAYCGTIFLMSLAFSQFSKKLRIGNTASGLMIYTAFTCLFVVISWTQSFSAAVLIFCLMQGFLTISRTMLGIRFAELIPSEARASIFSLLSLISRFGAMAGLSIASTIEAPHMMWRFFSFISILMIISFLSFRWFFLKKMLPHQTSILS